MWIISRNLKAQNRKVLYLTPVNPGMVVRETIPGLANLPTDGTGQGPAHVHLHMPPQLILLLHHLATADTFMPQLAFPIQTLLDQPVKTQIELWENKVKVYRKREFISLQKSASTKETHHSWLTIKSGCEIQSGHVRCYSAVTERSSFWMAWGKYCTGGWDPSGLLRVFLSSSCLTSSFRTPCTYKHQDPTPQRYTSLSSSPKPSWSLKWKCQFHVWCMFYFKMKHKSRHCPWRQNFPFMSSIIVLG